ncbi:MAG: GMC family oxidoreductase [Gammaproteobacteria bacterium]|nr:GMC family oxidoreductase [Gammaproteobacteria bacterium]
MHANGSYDYIIVGSGAGGCAAAYGLTRTGARVLMIEKGDVLPRDGSTQDVDRVIRDGAFKSRETWLDGKSRKIVPEEYFNLGGKTKWYGAALLRFSREEFASDPAHGCLGWPISYDELAPYYDQAEALLGVRTFAPERALSAMLGRMTGNGSRWQASPLPLGLASEIVEHRDEAAHFDGFASVLGLKADAEQALLVKVREQPNLRLVTGNPVVAFFSAANSARRIAGVICHNGARYEGKVVLLAAGAMHSPRLLQRHLEDTGLAHHMPSYRVVGRNYKLHLLTAVLAFSHARNDDLLRKTTLLLNASFPHSSVQPLGFDGDLIAGLIPRVVPRPLAHAMGTRAYGFFLQTEDGSSEQNRVVAAVNGGLPRLDYDPARLPAARREHRRFVRSFRRALLRAGFPNGAESIPITGTAHACGTLVAGTDRASSVVDADGRVHDMDNLYVVDGSVLPRSSKVNPSLTIYAWALRVTDRLASRGVIA